MLIDNELGCDKNNENDSKEKNFNNENQPNMFSFRKISDSPQKLKTSFALSSVSEKTQRLLQQPKSEFRNIPKLPYKVLDAPDLHDDFYLNLVDWSSRNILAVGLGTSVYLWSAYNSKVLRLFDAAFEQDIVTSVAWHSKGLHLAVGTYKGRVQIWDVDSKKRIGVLPGHDARVGALAWNSHLLASGSRDRLILLRDIREKESSGENNFVGFTNVLGNFIVDKREYTEKSIRDATMIPSTSNNRRPRILKSSRLSKVSEIFRNLDAKDKPITNSSDDDSASKRINKAKLNYRIDQDKNMGSPYQTDEDNDEEKMDSSDDEMQCEPSMDSKRNLSLDNPLSAVTGISRSASPAQKSLSAGRSLEEFPSIRKENGFRPLRILRNHRQEICGLKWSPEGQYLASGGNDNQLFIWDPVVGGSAQPIYSYDSHVAAVKAIAWSPHKHGLLASGGGTADRTIRFWNTLTGQALHSVDTGSQVCNIVWSPHDNELLTTHGYSENQILVWQYPAMKRLAKLIGHTSRVLYLAISPDGENIVTGAGDETLRFWNVFAKNKDEKSVRSSLNLFECMR